MATIDNQIKKLIEDNSISRENIAILLQDEGFISNLISFMQLEKDKLNGGENPLLKTQIASGSLFDSLTAIDLDSHQNWQDLLAKINQKAIWNTSLLNAINKFLADLDGKEIGDAGENFENSPYVKPNINLSEKTYEQSRSDFNEKAAQSTCHLDYTELDNVSNALRLLMPQYRRRVEIEDLDRNFWVIGTTISKCFDAIKDLLSEVTQIWENLLYLWAAIYILNSSRGIHTEILVLPNDALRPYTKFDNFDSFGDLSTPSNVGNNLNGIQSRLNTIAEKYPNYDLCIVPVIRKDNYYKDYYNKECWVGYFTKKKESQDWKVNMFVLEDNSILIFDIDNYKDKIGAISDDKELPYYTAPFSNINTRKSDLDQVFYGMVRIVPKNLSVGYDEDNEIVLNSLVWECYDASRIDTTSDILLETYTYNPTTKKINVTTNSSSGSKDITRLLPTDIKMGKGYARNELISDFEFLKAEDTIIIDETNLTLKDVKMPVIYKSGLSAGEQGPFLMDVIKSSSLQNALRNYSVNILQSDKLKQDENPEAVDYLRLYRGHFPVDAFVGDSGFSSNLNNYYYSSGGDVYKNTGYSSLSDTLHYIDISDVSSGTKSGVLGIDRSRDSYYRGCAVMLPNGTVKTFDDYCFLNVMLPLKATASTPSAYQGDVDRACKLYVYADNYGRDSTDTSHYGRRSKVVNYRKIYGDSEGRITESKWACVITEVSMTYAPAINSDSSKQWTYAGEGFDRDGLPFTYSAFENGVKASYCPENSINSIQSIPSSYAPFPMLAEHNGSKGYYFPVVTRVSEHLFYCNNGNYGYARRSKNGLLLNHNNDNDYSWVHTAIGNATVSNDLPNVNMNSFDMLNIGFKLVKTGTSWNNNSTLKNFIIRVTNSSDGSLDFYSHPCNGYSI